MKSMFRPLVIAAAIASAVSPIAANAGTSASFSASNLYLFRGVDVSKGNAQVAGSLDYSHDTGLYAGIWTTSAGDTQEYDLYAGFKGEVSGFGYEIGLIDYNYPDSTAANGNEDLGDSSEVVLGFSAGPAAFKVYSSLQGDNSTDPDSGGAYEYYTLSYTTDMMSVTLGAHDLSEPKTVLDKDTMVHLDVSYFATDELTLTVSQVVDNAEIAPNEDAFNDDTLFLATYSKKFDL